MFPPKTRADVGMVQCASEGHGKPAGGKTIGTRRRAGPCKEGGQPVHTKPRSLTFADFEYICTIPTSGNILPCLLATTAQPFRLFSFPFAPTGTALQFIHLAALLCSIFPIHKVYPCKLLATQSTLLCSRIWNLLLFQFIMCFHVRISCRLHILWVNSSLM